VLEHFGDTDLLAILDCAGRHYDRIHRGTQPRILLEAAVVELCRWESRVVLSDLVSRLRGLLVGGGPATSGSQGQSAPRRGTGAAVPPKPPVQSSARPAANTVTGWTDLVNAVMSQNPGLASCLMTGLPDLDREQNRLTVAFEPENAFMLDRLEQGRADLERHVNAFYGQTLKIVLQTVGAGAGPSTEQQEAVRREVAPTDRETLAEECQTDPTLGRLVDLVKGEPVADTEREKWQSHPVRADAPAEDPSETEN
jgi:hypothetical protein